MFGLYLMKGFIGTVTSLFMSIQLSLINLSETAFQKSKRLLDRNRILKT